MKYNKRRKATKKQIEATINLYKYYYEQYPKSTKDDSLKTILHR